MNPTITSDQLHYLREMGPHVSVLYAEDDPKIRLEMMNYLGKFFPNVVACSDGEEGLGVYQKSRFDIVVTDIQMPKMTGIEMLREIKKINPLQEMIITSAYTESDYFMEAISLGIDAYILKPVNHAQIIEVLYKTVSKIIQVRENEEYRYHLEALVDLKVKSYQSLEEERIENYANFLCYYI